MGLNLNDKKQKWTLDEWDNSFDRGLELVLGQLRQDLNKILFEH